MSANVPFVVVVQSLIESNSLQLHELWPTKLLCPWISQSSMLEWVAISFGDLPDTEIEPMSPALQVDSLTLSHQGILEL